jgi:hypothetical protein
MLRRSTVSPGDSFMDVMVGTAVAGNRGSIREST